MLHAQGYMESLLVCPLVQAGVANFNCGKEIICPASASTQNPSTER